MSSRNFIHSLETLKSRFEWQEKNGTTERTNRENLKILHSLSEYFEYSQNREKELFAANSALIEKLNKRGFFILMHAYSDYVLRWIDEANFDFLESEVEFRRRKNLPMMPGSVACWMDLEANQRIVIKKAYDDIKEQKLKREDLPRLIKLHSFRYEQCN